MIKGKRLKFVPASLLAGAVFVGAVANGGCSSTNPADASCDEFSAGGNAVASLQINGKVKAFVQAASDLQTIATKMETDVLAACIAIDTDLGVTDTWSAKSSKDDQLTEACNQASTKINAILQAGVAAQVTCGLSMSGGECTVDAQAQVNCEGQCKADVSCQEPDITVRCSPGDLSVQCSGNCTANATCEGSATAKANCQGTCSADCSGECDVTAQAPSVNCQGTCSGKCTGTCDGNSASGVACAGVCKGKCDANCTYTGGVQAHCEGSCKGTCTGDCKIDANAKVQCGGNVSCKGGCDVQGTAPKCEGKLTPPKCQGDANCQASCSSSAQASAKCTAPTVALECQGTVSSDLQKLIATLQKNLPNILLAAQAEGKLAIDAAGTVVTTGGAVVSAAGSFGLKELACAQAAVAATASASASVNVSFHASASVSGSASGS
jgi:hypothetical protein